MHSISTNISRGKGFSRRTTKEFVQFLFIAKGSAAEVQSQLYVALDQGYISQPREIANVTPTNISRGQGKFNQLYSKSDEVARLISGFIHYLLNKDKHSTNSRN